MTGLGFIGVGAMGARMCRRLLQAGYPVTVFDLNPAAVAEMAAAGARPAATAAAVAAAAEIILLSLPDGAAVRQAVLGEEGVVAGARPGAVVIDTSSSRPAVTQELGAALGARGVEMLDAPVSKGVLAAADGTLTIMVGGKEETLARCRPVLAQVGSQILHVGELGAGHVVKCLNNLLGATQMVAGVEALLLGRRYGIEPERLLHAVHAGPARTHASAYHIPRFILPQTYDSNFGLGLMYKDIQTAVDLAMAHQVPLFATGVVRQIYAAAVAAGMGAADNTAVARLVQQLLGQDLGEPVPTPAQPAG